MEPDEGAVLLHRIRRVFSAASSSNGQPHDGFCFTWKSFNLRVDVNRDWNVRAALARLDPTLVEDVKRFAADQIRPSKASRSFTSRRAADGVKWANLCHTVRRELGSVARHVDTDVILLSKLALGLI